MTTPPTRPPAHRVEVLVQVLILLTVGGVAAAASFTHVHNVAAAHGQPGWLAWADAVVLELMSIATGLEIQRRTRTGREPGFVLAVLIAAVVLSLAAQVVEAEGSLVGWLAAALPALAFLACVKIILSRTTATPTPTPLVPPVEPATTPTQPAPVVDRSAGEARPGLVRPATVAPVAVEAEGSLVGWLAAALPALAFLACVKIILSRTTATPTPTPLVPPVEPATTPTQPAPVVDRSAGEARPGLVRPATVAPVAVEAFTRLNGAPPSGGVR